MEMGKEGLDPHELQDRDEAPIPFAQGPEFVLQPREQTRLNGVPESG